MVDATQVITIIPIILALFGAIFFYFGKIISDSAVKKNDSSDNYVEGLFFSIRNVIVPIVAISMLDSLVADGFSPRFFIWTFYSTLGAMLIFSWVLFTRRINTKGKDTFREFRNPAPGLIFSFVSILLVFLAYKTMIFEIWVVLCALLAFMMLSVIAKVEGRSRARYPKVVIHTTQGKQIIGRLVAARDFFSVLKGRNRGIIEVNKDRIEYVEYLEEATE